MAVIETLCHPFATAKIVVWPATCSVWGGLIIAARSRDACGDATLCACGRRGERTGNCCDRDEGSKYLLHSRPSCACMACGHATAVPPKTARNSRRCMSTPAGHNRGPSACLKSVESRCDAVALGSNISVAAPFVRRCLNGSTMAPFSHPAHRTGLADFPHPALGQDFTPSPTARRVQAGSGVRGQSARKDARVDRSRPCDAWFCA